MNFGKRIRKILDHSPRLCVGIDPHSSLLAQWELPDTADGAERFGRTVVAAILETGARIVKPQVAFYERFGSRGFVALERVLAEARDANLVVIGDAKRGDIDSTQDAYAEAWLAPGSPLEVDAITISPYLGVGALRGTLELAEKHGKGTFTLVATSNPGAEIFQTAQLRETADSVAAAVIAEVSAFAREHQASVPETGATKIKPGFVSGVTRNSLARAAASAPWSSHGFVIGATVDLASYGLAASLDPIAPILAPGFGHQGADAADREHIFGSYAPSVIVAESRSILTAGPDGLAEAIRARL